MEDVVEKIDREINSQIESLSKMANGTEAKSAATDHLKVLIDANEEIKNNRAAAKQSKKDSRIGNVVKVGTLAVGIGGLAFNVVMCIAGFKFEETGTFTSKTLTRIMPGKFNTTTK